ITLHFPRTATGRFQESNLFEELFEQIVRQCVEVGLVQGKELSVDGSFVEANAAKESRIPREQLAEAAQVHHTVQQYLKEVEQQNPVEEPVHEQDQVSTTDPDSTCATKGGTPARLGYYDNYLVLLCYKKGPPQQGHPESCRSKTLAMVCRRVAMDEGIMPLHAHWANPEDGSGVAVRRRVSPRGRHERRGKNGSVRPPGTHRPRCRG